jgi:3-oxoacyl-(acyl-carrier-protein) synthase
MIGDPFSAGGLLQIAASVGSMVNGFVSPTINYRVKDDDCDLDYVANKSRMARINNILINNFGPGGNNASVVISKYH